MTVTYEDRTTTDGIWFGAYRDGVPHDIGEQIDGIPSLNHMLEAWVRDYGSRPAFVSAGSPMTYAQTRERAGAFAGFLQSRGLGKGDRVALMMPNSLQYPVAVFGTLLAGATVVNVNPLYTARELNHQLRDSGARLLVVFENFAATAERGIEGTEIETVVLAAMGDLIGGLRGIVLDVSLRYLARTVPRHGLRGVRFNAALAQGRRAGLTEVTTGPEDIAFLQYTGGTTGVAKGAMLTHRNIIANVLQTSAWSGGELAGERLNILTFLPLYHVFSLTVNLFMFMALGGRNVLIANPRDTRRVLRSIRHEKFEVMVGINTLFNNLLNHEGFRRLDVSRLRLVIAGGAATQSEVAARWQAATGLPVSEGYGLTECSPVVCMNPIDMQHPERMGFNGTVGLPLPSTMVRLRRADGSWAGIGEEGEICVRGPQVMRGYWQRPAETALMIDAAGWLATGDIGVMDEQGFIRLVDRLKEMILVSGFNVYPSEIEEVVMMHPDVLEAAAIGVADDASGERVKIIVVPKSDRLTEAALLEHCRRNLTSYKMPKIVEFRHEELPKSPVGKILRRELRTPAAH